MTWLLWNENEHEDYDEELKSRVWVLFVAPDLLAWFFLCNWVWFFMEIKISWLLLFFWVQSVKWNLILWVDVCGWDFEDVCMLKMLWIFLLSEFLLVVLEFHDFLRFEVIFEIYLAFNQLVLEIHRSFTPHLVELEFEWCVPFLVESWVPPSPLSIIKPSISDIKSASTKKTSTKLHYN